MRIYTVKSLQNRQIVWVIAKIKLRYLFLVRSCFSAIIPFASIVTVICYAVVILGAVACHSEEPKTHIPEPRINVVKAYKKEVSTYMQFPGQTYSFIDVTIQPRVSGYLLSINYNSGMPVKAGQLLFEIDSNLMRVELAKARAMLASAKSQLVEAQNNYNRSVPLARINAISQSSLDQSIATLASAKANIQSAKASLESAEINLSYTRIYSPIDGIIGATVGSVGDYVGLQSRNPVLNTISNIDSIYAYVSITTPKYLSIIKRDSLNRPLYDNNDLLTDINMILADGSVYPYKGIYKYTKRAINSQTGSVVIVVIFPNPERTLKPDQYVRVSANVGNGIETVLVPQRAVIQRQGINSVYVVGKDNTAQYRAVTLGSTYGTEWGILNGVDSGEMVLTEGFQKIRSGMKIIPVESSISTNSSGSVTVSTNNQ